MLLISAFGFAGRSLRGGDSRACNFRAANDILQKHGNRMDGSVKRLNDAIKCDCGKVIGSFRPKGHTYDEYRKFPALDPDLAPLDVNGYRCVDCKRLITLGDLSELHVESDKNANALGTKV